MNNYKFTIRNIMEKELNIQEENIDEAIDLFLKITNQTDILENNLEDDENSYFEFDIETDDDGIEDYLKEHYDICCDDELDDDIYEDGNEPLHGKVHEVIEFKKNKKS